MSTENNQFQENKNSDFGLPPAEFRPIPERRGNTLRIIVILLFAVLLISAGAVYWFFYHESTRPHQDTYINGNEAADSEFIEDDDLNISTNLSKDNQDDLNLSPTLAESQQGDEMQPSFIAKASNYSTHKPSKGTITEVDNPQGQYYAIVGSFIDGDLASDHANKLANQGIDSTILAPKQRGDFFRVAVAQADTFYAANEKIEELKSSHGNKIWVKKY